MNYEQMSDFEINKAVAEALSLRTDNGHGFIDTDNKVVCFDRIENEDGNFFDIEVRVNYCNNPADAWPVIVENGITLIHEGKEWSALANASVSSGWDVSFDHVCWHENPLRAAMIVFLMMQEAK